MRRVFAVIAMSVLLASGCGDDEDGVFDNGAIVTTTTAPADPGEDAPTTTTDPGNDEDDADIDGEGARAEAERLLVSIDDMPPGWREIPTTDDEDTFAYEDHPECQHLAGASDLVPDELAASRDFQQGDAEASFRIAVLPEEATAAAFVEAWSQPGTVACLLTAMEEFILESLDFETAQQLRDLELDVGRLSIEPVGDARVAYQVVVTMDIDGFVVDLIADVVVVQVGSTLAQLVFADAFAPVFERDQLIHLQVSKLRGSPVGGI